MIENSEKYSTKLRNTLLKNSPIFHRDIGIFPELVGVDTTPPAIKFLSGLPDSRTRMGIAMYHKNGGLIVSLEDGFTPKGTKEKLKERAHQAVG